MPLPADDELQADAAATLDERSPAGKVQAGSAAAVAGRELGGRLAGRSLIGQVVYLAVWPFFELLLNSLVSIVDTAVAGRLSVAAADAIAVAGYVGWLMAMLLMAVGTGSTALVARAVGARHRGLANATLGQSLLIAAGWGVVVGAGIFAGAEAIASFFRLGPEATGLAVTYLQILAVAGPAAGLLIVGSACLRGAGDTRTPFMVMIGVNGVNVLVSVTLAFGWGGLPRLGVAGIALGTAAAHVTGAVLTVGVLAWGRGGIRLRWHRLRPHPVTMKRIIRVGLPNLAESSGMWIGNALIGRIVGGLPVAGALGTHIIAIRLESLSFLPAVAIGMAAATLTGQYLGLGDANRARQAAKLAWLIGGTLATGMGAVFFFFPEMLARLLSDEPALYARAAPLVWICGPAQFFFATYLILSHAIRGAGDTTVAMIITYASTFLVRLPLAWVLAVPLGYGLPGLWVGLCAELVVRGSLFTGRFLHGGWARKQV